MTILSHVRFALCLALIIGLHINLQAQWRSVPVSGHLTYQTGVMFDDGSGVLISESAIVHTSTDEWNTAGHVPIPNVGLARRFIARDMDTSENGTIYVVGYLDSIVPDEALPMTYAMLSIDHGATWSEVGERLPGRFQSVSFRGMSKGIVMHEYVGKSALQTNLYAMTMRTLDEQFLLQRIDTLDGLSDYRFVCNEGAENTTAYATLVDSVTILISQINSCFRDTQQDPLNKYYHALVYRSTDGGASFVVVDSARSTSFVRPVKPKVLGKGFWTGLPPYLFDDGGQTSVNSTSVTTDGGNTWMYRECAFEKATEVKTEDVASIRISRISDSAFFFLSWDTAIFPGPVVLEPAIVRLSDCNARWDSAKHEVPGNGAVLREILPYAGGTKFLIAMTSYLDEITFEHLLVYDRGSLVSVRGEQRESRRNVRVVHAEDDFVVETNAQFGLPYTLHIRDIAGRIVLSEVVTTYSTRVNVQHLALGTYIVSVQNDRGILESILVSLSQ